MKSVSSFLRSAKEKYIAVGQKFGATRVAPTSATAQVALFALGVALVGTGIAYKAAAQDFELSIDFGGLEDHGANYNDSRIAQAAATILRYIEGSFGALIMVGAGIAAIISSAFGQYRAALGCLVVAVGAFILRSVMTTFFNTDTIDEGQG